MTIKKSFNHVNMLNSKAPLSIGNNKFILPIEMHGSDDYCSSLYWYDDNKFSFSSNIKIVASVCIQSGGAVIVEKIDPSIAEKVTIYTPKGDVVIIF